MIEYKTELKKIISLVDLSGLEDQINSISKLINEKDLANFFVDSIYLQSVIQLIIDDFWIQSKNSETEIQFRYLIKNFFNAELKPLLYLHADLATASIDDMHIAAKALAATEKLLIKSIKSKPSEFQKKILQISLHQMSELYELEHQLNVKQKTTPERAKLSLYRSFDALDQILELNYLLNEVALIDQKERLYEGAGVGVQSSYATTLIALRYLNLTKASKFIDLGSGYGRVGLVVGLMRPDIQFTGYEFVKERVDIANKACTRLNLDKHVSFVTQDLSLANFKIPQADTYYIFDAFTDASYVTIMDQLQEIAQVKKIVAVTKGNAKLWFKNKYWTEPQEFNDGNLCFFRSRGSRN
ncbi:methyltransferase [bacterium]|nr:methyltransferase [bacterium]